jgi:hypothetical protein
MRSKYLLVIVIIMGWMFEAAPGRADNSRGTGSGDLAANTTSKMYVIPHSADSSPYRDQYSTLDLWVIEHAVAQVSSFPASTEGSVQVCGYVDGDGYLLPELVRAEQTETALEQGVYLQQLEANKSREVRAVGKPYSGLDQDLSALNHSRMAIRSVHYPKIPQWLAENPPVECWIMPDGNVVTVGLLGGGENYQGSSTPSEAPGYTLYSPQGSLLKGPVNDWYLLYLSAAEMNAITAEAEARGWDGKEVNSFGMGFIGMSNPQGELVTLYDYTGVPLSPVNVMAHKRDMHNFLPLSAKQISQVYSLQQ